LTLPLSKCYNLRDVTTLPTLTPNAISPTRARLNAAISHALDFLYRSQLPYGEFKTYAARNKQFKNARFDSSPFVTAWVLDCIGHWHGRRVKIMTTRALRFLRAEMEGPGVWRYWSSRNPTHDALPPDLDDTCCISCLLRQHQLEFPDNRKFILANRNPQGLFYTWLLPRAATSKSIARALQPLVSPGASALWSIAGILDNVDWVVNANVLYYLGDCAETRAAIAYLVDCVRGKHPQVGVSFYPDSLTFYYLLSRAYATGVKSLAEIRDVITGRVLTLQNRRGSFGNELLTALAICTLLNFDKHPSATGKIAGINVIARSALRDEAISDFRPTDIWLQQAVRYLLTQQNKNGAWRRISAFLGPAPYYGSEELTTALCIQALAGYYHILDTSKENVHAVL
jgi:hypothetical protein